MEGGGRQLFRGIEKGYRGVEVVSCLALHILQTYISSWPGVRHFSPQVLRVFVSALISLFFSFFPVSLPSCSGVQLPPPQLPAVLLTLKHVLPITALL